MMGGGKGGADFDPKGKSDNEIRKFCTSFMRELSRHIGPDTDVPAGDIGVGGREIGYLFGAYKKYRNAFQGVLTGKGLDWGGSLIRPEATGYGLVYYVSHMIAYASNGSESFKDKTVAISGSGNVAQFAALKVIELGGKVVSLSDSKGCLIAKDLKTGFDKETIASIAGLKLKRLSLTDLKSPEGDLAEKYDYIPGARPWTKFTKLDVALPCATQNEVSGEEAEALVKAGVKFVAEGSNMGCTKEAIDVFEESRISSTATTKGIFRFSFYFPGSLDFILIKGIWYGPGKAANCGGVAVSGLEMAQNSQRLPWTSEEVDAKLAKIMESAFNIGIKTATEYTKTAAGAYPSLVAGSNIGGSFRLSYFADNRFLEGRAGHA